MTGFLPVEESECFAETAWESYYEHHPDFREVVFSQFKPRLRGHLKQIRNGLLCSKVEERAMDHDRQIFEETKRNERGELIFDFDVARDLLRADVAKKLHVGVTPLMLWHSREEYQKFDKSTFRQKIYQTIRWEKFINHLENERKRKGKLLRCKPPGNFKL